MVRPYVSTEDLPITLNLLRGLDDVRTVLLQGKSEFYYRCPSFAMIPQA